MIRAAVRINAEKRQHKISRYLYGQFAEHLGRCVYESVCVGAESKIPNDGSRVGPLDLRCL